MDRYELIEAMERNRDPIKAVQMEKYMKDQFKFLGLQSVKEIIVRLAASLFSVGTTLSRISVYCL